MVFTSANFVIFLILTVVLYYVLPKKVRWLVLLLASCIFYIAEDVKALGFMAGTTVITYAVSQCFTSKNDDRKGQKGKGVLFVIALLLDLGVLLLTKYTGFAYEIINTFRKSQPLTAPKILAPMGVSFYTFRTVAYLADVYRGKCSPEKNPLKFFLYISFFPTVVQGPITRYADLAPHLYSGKGADEKTFWFGVQRILWGFFKKLVIADRAGIAVQTIVGDIDTFKGGYALFYIALFMFELYADFSGGMDIALGVSELFGIPVQENFLRPFFSKSAGEFWRRWHATMGAFFRDYIYIPLGGDGRNAKTSAGKNVVFYRNMIVVWLATGLWHGAGFNFIIWGVLNLAVLLLEAVTRPLTKKFQETALSKTKGFQIFRMVRTTIIVSFIMSLLSFSESKTAFALWGSIFTTANYGEVFGGGLLNLGLVVHDYVILGVGFVLLFLVALLQRTGSVREKLLKLPYVLRFLLFLVLFVSILLFGIYGVGYDASQFIYNRF